MRREKMTEKTEGKQGAFIVLDGPEGAGKSTQTKLLQKHFGEKMLVTREPGGSDYAEEIRSVILNSSYAGRANAQTMFALFWAARADHIEHTILPALQKGQIVVSDRFDSTTFMYQLYGQGARELEDLFWIMRKEYVSVCEPDLYIFLDIDPQAALARKNQNGDEMNHFDEREKEFHERVQLGMHTFKQKVSSVIVSGDESPENVQQELVKIIEKYL